MNWTKYLSSDRIKLTARVTAGDPRNEYDSDYGRIIFSPAIRRMHDKTQVFPLTSDDNIHSRLTHSMEVMALGYSIGLRICESEEFTKKTKINKDLLLRSIPIILQNACLVHDIGNPPFGHFGEAVIANYFQEFFKEDKLKLNLTNLEEEDFKFFDGNAQGLRVLTKLQVLNEKGGLNLTYATLGAFLKYPNSQDIDKNFIAKSKRGVFQSELSYLKLISEKCDLIKSNSYTRHPLSFLMEAADSIAYLVMDVEDGYNKGLFDFAYITSKLGPIESLKIKFEELDKLNGLGSEISKIVKLRIHIIQILVTLAVTNFINNLEDICEGKYNKELIKDDESKLAEKLNGICTEKIFKSREIQQLELTGHSVLSGLLDYYIDFIFVKDKNYRKRAMGLISESVIRGALIENDLTDFESLTNYYKLRIIVDYISGMTDRFALDQFQRLSGQKI